MPGEDASDRPGGPTPLAFRGLLQRRVPGIRSLLVQLVLAIYLPALIAAVALVALETRNSWAVTEEDLLSRTTLLSRGLRQHIEGIHHHLGQLAEQVPADEAGWSAFDAEARRTALAAGLDGIVLIKPNGEHVVNTGVERGLPLPSRSPDALARVARTGQPALLDVARGPISGRLIVGVAVPVVRDGHVLYALAAGLEARRLQRLLDNAPFGWIAAIVDSQGVLVARTPRPDIFAGRTITPDLRQRLLGEEEGIVETTTLDNVPVLTAFRTLPSLGWSVVVSVPRATLYAPVWSKAAYLAAGAAILLALGLWLAVRLRRSIVLSVNTLVDEALRPPLRLPAVPLAFSEANELRIRLHENSAKLERAQSDVHRMHARFQRALVQQMDRRQAEIAGELHDNVGSTLAGASLLLAQLEPRLQPGDRPLMERALAQLERAIANLRQISRGILPAGEQQGALPAALEQLVAQFNRPGARCSFASRGDFSQLSPEAAGHLYRIAQEAVANAVRHAATTRIRVMLSGSAAAGRLTVDDDGIGLRPQDVELHPGIGLKSMRARALAIDGKIGFADSPLGGTRVRVTFPLQQPHRRHAGVIAESMAAT